MRKNKEEFDLALMNAPWGRGKRSVRIHTHAHSLESKSTESGLSQWKESESLEVKRHHFD